ncbi:ParA family protein [Fimbriiglobus ruber]|uniref:Chromosome (Plasmid) partitioning protein ParA / Sporulation initiation inhibitor protein Soj n=1 Tax=Fimbriiglobus ruber TaxID=1908690 RepID=A0A225DHK2_9BACT|nr:ParA family protein [Fimbriiglobus ruber]OWK35567.1 Chromosome (plasmid) partitioning protein ParA / Sporulation initiation inhibitor protein Soj [Fimbriiglobus ruber]
MTITLEQALAIAGSAVTAITFLVGGIDFLIRRWLQRHRYELVLTLNQQIATLHNETHNRSAERDTALHDLATTAATLANTTAALATSSADNTSLNGANADLAGKLTEANLKITDAAQRSHAHDTRVQRALELEGALWTQPTMANTPKFVPLAERRTPVVSVLNLKGGVGKTTITAYLAKALSRQGYRVLLVDLDLQGSLSSLFVSTLELARLSKEGGRFLKELLTPDEKGKPGNLLEHTLPVPQLGPHARLVPTTDTLAYAELSETVKWLFRVGGKEKKWNGRRDGRMILRRALHRPAVYKKFDVVLMDCPPLLNLCCANALAASDYVLAPVTPSMKAIERVTPLIKRVLEVQSDVNKHLRMLGIVVNNTRHKGLTDQENDLFLALPEQCLTIYGHDVYRFDTSIPNRVAVRDQEKGFDSENEDTDLRDTFEQLANEFIKKLPGVCRHPDERIKAKKPKTIGGM